MHHLEALRVPNATGDSSGRGGTKLSASLGVEKPSSTSIVKASAGTVAVTIPAMDLDLKSQMIIAGNRVPR